MKIEYNGNIDNIMLAIKHIMLDKDLKQKDICNETKLSKQTISNLLNGRTENITFETLDKICKALNCKLYIEIE